MSRKHGSSENRDENSEITRAHAHSANIGTNAHIIRTVCQYFIYFVFRENFPTINHKRAKTAYREECCFSTSVEGGKKKGKIWKSGRAVRRDPENYFRYKTLPVRIEHGKI